LEADRQVTERRIEDNLENGEEHVGLTKTPYHNLMLEKQVIRKKERPIRHKLFLPQEVVHCEI
jgi:hypothetical protein